MLQETQQTILDNLIWKLYDNVYNFSTMYIKYIIRYILCVKYCIQYMEYVKKNQFISKRYEFTSS